MTPHYYGQHNTFGVLSDHLDLAEQKGYSIQQLSGGSVWVHKGTGVAYRVLCSEIVWIDTEDGRVDGRCGKPVVGSPWCPYHKEVVESWACNPSAF